MIKKFINLQFFFILIDFQYIILHIGAPLNLKILIKFAYFMNGYSLFLDIILFAYFLYVKLLKFIDLLFISRYLLIIPLILFNYLLKLYIFT